MALDPQTPAAQLAVSLSEQEARVNIQNSNGMRSFTIDPTPNTYLTFCAVQTSRALSTEEFFQARTLLQTHFPDATIELQTVAGQLINEEAGYDPKIVGTVHLKYQLAAPLSD